MNFTQKKNIDLTCLPKHIAVIMDGNGRWAQKRGIKRIFGHQNAIKATREITEGCAELGIACLTLYAFSTENWDRPKTEVDGLMSLLVSTIKDELPTLMGNNIKLSFIGNENQLPPKAKNRLRHAIDLTSEHTGMELVLALNYSGRWDILNAVNALIASGETSINATTFSNYLSTRRIPEPELLIRTSGEMRISNFLLWQLAYTELYFTDVLWPDFRKANLYEAIMAYQKRERRFGKLSEQLKAKEA